jgi:hypothetical protein
MNIPFPYPPTSLRGGDTTVALIEFASRSLPAKLHLKKNPEAKKLDGKL